MYYSQLNKLDTVNGPGCRVSLFVSGCNHGCKGCWNPETWDFKNGSIFTNEQVSTIVNLLNQDFYSGFSLLGGEPLAKRNLPDVIELLKIIKSNCKNNNIWVWSGYYLNELTVSNNPLHQEVLQYIDVLVDGRYDESLRDLTLQYRGSSNQTINYLKRDSYE